MNGARLSRVHSSSVKSALPVISASSFACAESVTRSTSATCDSPAMGRPEPTVIGLVGGTGDLARRMVIPGCFHLMVAGLLPEQCRIVGLALDDLDDDGFKDARPAVARRARAGRGRGRGVGALRRDAVVRARRGRRRLREGLRGRRAGARRLAAAAVPPRGPAVGGRGGRADDRRRGARRRGPHAGDPGEAVRHRSRLRAHAQRAPARGARARARSSGSTTSSARKGCRTSSRCASPTPSSSPVFNRDHVDSIQIDVPESLTIVGRARASTSRPAA